MELLRITAITFGAHGVAHRDGKTILVPQAAPGDLIEAEIIAERHDYATARIVRVVESGPARRDPPCPYLPRCGGCDWQQIDYPAQVEIKAELLTAEFRRPLGFEVSSPGLVEPAAAEFAYRSRIRLKVGPDGALGYHELENHRLVPIGRCLVAAVEVAAGTELARALAARCRELEIVEGDRGVVLIAHLVQAPGHRERTLAERIVAGDPGIGGIILRGGGERYATGAVTVTLDPEPGCAIRGAADHFSQVNHAQNRKLVATVIEMADLARDRVVLDLFCGAGNLSLPAARRGAIVTGVDADHGAIAAARENAARMELGNAQFIAMAADETARFLGRARYRSEVAILDPPRTGALNLMEPLARLRPQRIIYVSCDPPTLVRDLAVLTARRYQVARVQGFDFFPNTHHLEVAVELAAIDKRKSLP